MATNSLTLSPSRDGSVSPTLDLGGAYNSSCYQVNWGDPRPWGLDPAYPKDVTKGSWSPLEEEFKDRQHSEQATQGGKLIKVKSTRSRCEACELKRWPLLTPRVEFLVFFELLTRG